MTVAARRLAGVVSALTLAVVAVFAGSAQAAAPTKTLVGWVVTGAGSTTNAYGWTIAVAASPPSQMVAVGKSASVQWSITTTQSASPVLGASMSGKVCVANLGSVATQGLAISDQVTRPPSKTVLATAAVNVSASPQLAPWASYCYPYQVGIPGSSVFPGGVYLDTALVTITNASGPGASLPSPVVLPKAPAPANSSIAVSDTNGQSFSFSSGGTVSYAQAVACPSAAGAQTLSDADTATIQSTGQTATGTATVHCGAPTTLGTQLSATTITAGNSASDQGTITGAQPGAAGTISYQVYSDSSCQTSYANATPTDNTVVNGVAPASTTVTFPTAATYYWRAVYSGDAASNTLASTSPCTSEPLVVTTGWQTGELTTYLQPEWSGQSGSPTPISNDFDSVYASNYDELTVGGGFTMSFDSPAAVASYLPASGPPAPLDANLLDPTSSASGTFGGDVVALALNVDYSAAGDLPATSGLQFGDLTVCGLTTDTDLNGMTVSQVLAILNTALGGGATTDNIANLDPVAIDLDNAFIDGTPSTFALADLAKNSECAPVSWQTGDLTTYTQPGWAVALAPHPAVTILNDNFDSVYGSTYDELTVGGGFTISFDSAAAVETYLPAQGPIGPLDANLLDPTSSASGTFGGDVVALALDVDFSAAGLLPGTSGLQFGDLTVCGLTTDTDLNGMTVSQVLAILNTALGGGTTTDSIATLDPVAIDLENSFTDGTPSTFAQDNLVNGACP